VFIAFVHNNQKFCAQPPQPRRDPGGVSLAIMAAAAAGPLASGRGRGVSGLAPGGVIRLNAEKNKKGS
jgi:hypothetical protein